MITFILIYDDIIEQSVTCFDAETLVAATALVDVPLLVIPRFPFGRTKDSASVP